MNKIKPPFIQTIENPLANYTIDQRKEIIADLAIQNKNLLDNTFVELIEILKEYNPKIILSIFSTYSLSISAGENGVSDNKNPSEIEQPHLEILQALFLTLPKNLLGKRLLFPQDLEKIHESLKKILTAFSYSRMDSNVFDKVEKEKEIVLFQELIRNHTSNIRNWGYFSQVKRIILELYEPFDSRLREKVGFAPSEAIKVFSAMISQTEKLMTEHSKKLRSLFNSSSSQDLIQKYKLMSSNRIDRTEELFQSISELHYEKDTVFNFIVNIEDQNLKEIYTFSSKIISDETGIDSNVIESILNFFSFQPGALEHNKTEHFFLDNPIWKKPIVKINNEYFCPIPILFFSNSFLILDSLVEDYFKEALHERRSIYLERKIETIVKKRFPELSTVARIKWVDDSITYESDLITFIDSYAIIFEAKSHRISSAALRGAPDRIKKHIEDIIISPGVQSKRLADRLKYLIDNPKVTDELRCKLPVDLKRISKILRVSVSLEDFATLQSNIGSLKGTHWIPLNFELCPTLNLADFETVFDFLDHPVHILHYFERRMELLLDEKVDIRGDELDYLGFYASTLFSQGYVNKEGLDNLNIMNMSKPIDHYYTSKDAGIIVPKPIPEVCELFKKILIKLEERETPGWTVLGVALSRYSPFDQENIINFIAQMKLKLSNNWESEDLENILIFGPPQGSDYGLAFVLYSDFTIHRKYEFIESAQSLVFDKSQAKYALIIAKNIDDVDMPYNYISVGRLVEN